MKLQQLLSYTRKAVDDYEMIQEGDVVFDYLIRKGISQTYNAIRLLEQTGFPREIIIESRHRCQKAQEDSDAKKVQASINAREMQEME